MTQAYDHHDRVLWTVQELNKLTQEEEAKRKPRKIHDPIFSAKGMRWDQIELGINLEKEKENFKGSKLLQQPTRKGILWILCMYPDCFYIAEIAKILDVTEACAQAHVKVLTEAGIVEKTKSDGFGNCVYPVLINREDTMAVLQFQERELKK